MKKYGADMAIRMYGGWEGFLGAKCRKIVCIMEILL